MPDITMCMGWQAGGTTCPLRHSCYRYTATPTRWRQSFFCVIPWNEEKQACDYYWKDEDEGTDGD